MRGRACKIELRGGTILYVRKKIVLVLGRPCCIGRRTNAREEPLQSFPPTVTLKPLDLGSQLRPIRTQHDLFPIVEMHDIVWVTFDQVDVCL